MSRRELIGKKTRIAFREFLVGWTLREIENEFSGAGLEPDLSHDPRLGGQLRGRLADLRPFGAVSRQPAFRPARS